MKKNKTKYEIIDNFLDDNDFQALKNTLESDLFPWYFQKNVAGLENETEKIGRAHV